MITEYGWEVVDGLCSTQVEADTRMMLHAFHASKNGYENIIICSEDTDVLILSLAFCGDIPATLYQRFTTQSRTRFLNVNEIALSLGSNICKNLPSLHAITGCDTV